MKEAKQSIAINIMVWMADATDHITGKAGLTLAVEASKDGAAFASISPTVTERGSGWYNLALTSSHTDTLGDLVVRATATGADPGERTINVVANVEADTYARVGAPTGASISADVAAVKADTGNIYTDTHTNGVVLPQAQADKVWSTGTRALTDKAGFSLSAAGIQAIWDALTSALTTAGSVGKKLADWVLGSDSKVILSANAQTGVTIPTVTTLTGHTAQTGDCYIKLGTPAGASVSADVAAVQADTNDIQGRLPTALVGGKMDVDKTGYSLSAAGVDAIWDEAQAGHIMAGTFGKYLDAQISAAGGTTAADVWGYITRSLTDKAGFALAADQAVNAAKINGSATAATQLALSAASIVSGVAIAGTLSATQMSTNLTEATDDHYNGRIIIWTAGALKDQATNITGYAGVTKVLTYTATTEAPAPGDAFVIV